MIRHSILAGFLAPLALFCAISPDIAHADIYPNRTITMVVPYAAGGGVDISARLVAQQMAKNLNQPIIIDNRAGASGMIGSKFVADAKPDGYTVLYASAAQALAPFLLPDVPLDVEHDLTPITLVAPLPYIMVVNPKIPAKDPKELVAWIKEHPSEFRWGLGGLGSPDHLGIEQFDRTAGIKPVLVPYKGTGPSVVAALSNEVGGLIAPPAAVRSYIESGQLRALGAASVKPLSFMPNLPTIASFGYPGFEVSAWYGMWGPRHLPRDLAGQIREAVVKALADPSVRAKLIETGNEPLGSTPDEFAAYFKSQLELYGPLIKALDLHAQQ